LTEFPQRRLATSAALVSRKLDGLLISSPANIRYLTGYAGSNGLILLTPGDAHFFTDPRYSSDAQRNIDCHVHIVSKGSLIAAAADIIKRKKFKKVGFEPAWMNVGEYKRLQESLAQGVRLHAAGGSVEALRAVKSADEIEKIRVSVKVNSEAYARAQHGMKIGMRESEIAAELDYQMRLLGAEKPAFDTIVASGSNTALPHAHPGARRLEAGDMLLVDMGATVQGYTSDMTRMATMGAPSKKIRGLYNAVLEAQLAAIEKVRAGVAAWRVDLAARDVLKRHKLEQAFVHSTGHGLGLEIHEGPRIAKKQTVKPKPQVAGKRVQGGAAADADLQAGMVITIEPGAYIDGLGGVRIEDTVLVTETGCEILTPTTKEFVQL
jgi:Xaa-Pro aminopeptidase